MKLQLFVVCLQFAAGGTLLGTAYVSGGIWWLSAALMFAAAAINASVFWTRFMLIVGVASSASQPQDDGC